MIRLFLCVEITLLFIGWQGISVAQESAVNAASRQNGRVIAASYKPDCEIHGGPWVCSNTIARFYSAYTCLGCRFDWTVTNGTILRGQGDNSIEVGWVDTATTATVTLLILDSNTFEASTCELSVLIDTSQKAKMHVDGSLSFCPGMSVILTADSNFNYVRWSNNSFQKSIEVTKAGKYWYVIDLVGRCIKSSDTVTVTVHPQPVAPQVYRRNDTLFSTPAVGYKWYAASRWWPIGHESWFVPTSDDEFFVTIVDSNDCESTSQMFPFTLTVDREPVARESFTIYPNPSETDITIAGRIQSTGKVAVMLYDLLGKERLGMHEYAAAGSYHRMFDVKSLPQGIYILRITTLNGGYTKRVVRR